MTTGAEKNVSNFPMPADLWQRVVQTHGRASQKWHDAFNAIPFEDIGGSKPLRFYQEIAVNKALRVLADGKPISAEEFLENLYGKLPEFFKDEEELRRIWSVPATRKILLEQLAEAGFGKDELLNLQRLINAEKSDLFDVLEYVSFATKPITREARVVNASSQIFDGLADKQKDFLSFVLSKYIETGISELDQEKLPSLSELKYQSITDAAEALGGVESIKNTTTVRFNFR